MSGNTLGKLFCVTSFGESHGPAIGCVVDGCPPGHGARRGRHPARSRPPQARHLAPRDAAARRRHRRDPVRRVRGQDHRHADRAAHPQRRCEEQGLLQDQGHVPAGARRLHLPAEVRHPRLPRRRAPVGARDRGARGGGGDREEMAAREVRRGRARLSGRSSARSRCRSSRGTPSTAIRFSWPTRRSCRSSRNSWTGCASPAIPAARDHDRRARTCRWAGASRCTTSSTPISPTT